MTTVLALDQASSTGFAVVDDGGIVDAGSWNLEEGIRKSGKNAVPLDTQHVLKVQRLRAEIAAVVKKYGVEVIAHEREFGRGEGGRLLVSLYTACQEAAFDAGLPCLGVRISDWRIAMHGTAGKAGKWHKNRAKTECAELGWQLDEDAAEAVQIARYVHDNIRVSPSTQPKGKAA